MAFHGIHNKIFKFCKQVSTEDPASQTLLQYEDEGKMLEWFLRLQMKIKEVVRLLCCAVNTEITVKIQTDTKHTDVIIL